MLWLDHAIFYIINHLSILFDEGFLMLKTKFAVFLVWIHDVVCMDICQQIMFYHFSDLMVKVALQFATDLEAKLLANYSEEACI